MVYELGGNMKLHDFKRKAKKAFRDPKWAVKPKAASRCITQTG